MIVRDFMTKNPVYTNPKELISTVKNTMDREKISKMPVLDDAGKLIGVITKTDLKKTMPSDATTLDIYELSYLISKMTVEKVMKKNPITIQKDATIEEAAKLMAEKGISSVIVMDGDVLAGILTKSDLFKAVVDMFGFKYDGVRASLEVSDNCGELAKISKAIADKQGKIVGVPENYAQKLVDFLLAGFNGSTVEGDFFHLAEISPERTAELQKLCSIDESMLPAENRIFVALANVIRKYKPSGVTVERIADELNMAKSSLYEYFENKNQMVKQLVNNEIALFQTIVNENGVEAANFTEYLFILVWTEFEYFSKRPSLIPICGWLLMLNDSSFNEQKQRSEQCDTIENPWEKRIPDRVVHPDLGFAYSARVLVHWLGVLPIALFIQMTDKGWNEEKQRQGIEILTDFIMNGVK